MYTLEDLIKKWDCSDPDVERVLRDLTSIEITPIQVVKRLRHAPTNVLLEVPLRYKLWQWVMKLNENYRFKYYQNLIHETLKPKLLGPDEELKCTVVKHKNGRVYVRFNAYDLLFLNRGTTMYYQDLELIVRNGSLILLIPHHYVNSGD